MVYLRGQDMGEDKWRLYGVTVGILQWALWGRIAAYSLVTSFGVSKGLSGLLRIEFPQLLPFEFIHNLNHPDTSSLKNNLESKLIFWC